MLLKSEDNKEEQTQNIIAVFMLIIMQSLKRLDWFNSLIVYFAAVLGIVEDKNRLCYRDKYSYMLASFIYYVQVLFVKHTLLAIT
jgi:hypothetical protein